MVRFQEQDIQLSHTSCTIDENQLLFVYVNILIIRLGVMTDY